MVKDIGGEASPAEIRVKAREWLDNWALAEDDVRDAQRRVAGLIKGLLDHQTDRPAESKPIQVPAGEVLEERIVSVLLDRGESLWNDSGVDHGVAREIAREVVTGTPPNHAERDKHYAVHVYALVRVKVCGVDPKLNPKDALNAAENAIDFSRLFDRDANQVPSSAVIGSRMWIDHVEWAESNSGFLVDFPNDPKYDKSTFFDADGFTPVDGTEPRVVVVVEGGNVQAVLKDRPGVAVAVFDKDKLAGGKLPRGWSINQMFRGADKVELDPLFKNFDVDTRMHFKPTS